MAQFKSSQGRYKHKLKQSENRSKLAHYIYSMIHFIHLSHGTPTSGFTASPPGCRHYGYKVPALRWLSNKVFPLIHMADELDSPSTHVQCTAIARTFASICISFTTTS